MYRKAFLAASFAAFLIAVFITLPMEEKPSPILSEGEVLEQIRKFNSSVSVIRSISCEVSAIGTKTQVVYIKPSGLLSTTSSFGRKKAEVATDGKEYWFWMKDFDRASIYHCPLSKISSTRVILPMRPNLIKSALAIDEIESESILIQEGTARLKSPEDDLAKCVLFRNGRIVEIVYYRGESPLMTAKFKSHQSIDGFEIPKNVNVFWHEENASLDFEIKNVVINLANPPEIKMPEGMKKISLIDF
jgi:hypothetical protein